MGQHICDNRMKQIFKDEFTKENKNP